METFSSRIQRSTSYMLQPVKARTLTDATYANERWGTQRKRRTGKRSIDDDTTRTTETL